jgi:hypothetical protein
VHISIEALVDIGSHFLEAHRLDQFVAEERDAEKVVEIMDLAKYILSG